MNYRKATIFSVAFLLVIFAAVLLSGCGQSENSEGGMVEEVVVHTTVTPGGEFPDYLDVRLRDVPRKKLDPADFSMTGHATNWMDPSEHEFHASFAKADLNGSILRLWFDGFTDKYFFVTDWEVTDRLNSDLNFTSDKISKVETPVADDFQKRTLHPGDGEGDLTDITYWIYEPDGSSGSEPYPLVLVFHGYGDTNNIRTYRTSVAWAEPSNQEVRPCYVFSPVIENSYYTDETTRKKIYQLIYSEIQTMIEEGRVDPSRIYVMGNSFGGMATVEFAEEYPDFVAGGIALCSAVNYSEDALDRLDRITNIPFFLAAAKHDGTIPSSVTENLYRKLTELGDTEVSMKIYSDEEMNAAGADPDPDSTFSYHHVEMAVMEDPSYMEWLFSKSK